MGKFLLDQLDKGGVSVDAQIGDRQNTLGSSVGAVEGDGNTVNQTETKVAGGAEKVVINEANNWMTIFLVLLALIGWMLPPPQDIIKSLRGRK